MNKIFYKNADPGAPASDRSPTDPQMTNFERLEIGGSRIAILTSGRLYAMDTASPYGWTLMTDNVTDFRVSQGDLVAVKRDGTIAWKRGDLGAGWEDRTPQDPQMKGFSRFDASGSRIAIARDGRLYAMDINTPYGWTLMTDNVTDFRVSQGDLVAVKRDGTIAWKRGGLGAGWEDRTPQDPQMKGFSRFDVGGSRIAIVSGGRLYAMDINTPYGWTLMTDNVDQVQVSENCLAVVKTDQRLWIKFGDLGAGWTQEGAGAVASVRAASGRLAWAS